MNLDIHTATLALYIHTATLAVGNDIGRKGATKLAPAIGHLKRLEKLGLAGEHAPL